MTSIIESHSSPVAEFGVNRFFEGTLSAIDLKNTSYAVIKPVTMAEVIPGGEVQFTIPQRDGQEVYNLQNFRLRIGFKLKTSQLGLIPLTPADHKKIMSKLKRQLILSAIEDYEGCTDTGTASSATTSAPGTSASAAGPSASAPGTSASAPSESDSLKKKYETRFGALKAVKEGLNKLMSRGKKKRSPPDGSNMVNSDAVEGTTDDDADDEEDGADEGDDSIMNVSFVNNTLHSMIKGYDFIFGTTNMNPGSREGYAWIQYIKYLTSFNTGEKNSWMNCQGWYDDSAGFMQSYESNEGFNRRKEYFIKNGDLLDRTYYLEGNFGHALSGTSVPCPPGIPMKLILYLNNLDFLLIQDTHDTHIYNLEFISMELILPVGLLSDEIYGGLMQRWTQENKVLLPYRRYKFDNDKINKGTLHHSFMFQKSNELPSRIIFFFVDAKKIQKRSYNPFDLRRTFDGVYIQEVRVNVNSNIVDNRKWEMDETECMSMFSRLNDVCGFFDAPANNHIKYEDFNTGGFFICCYDLTVNKKAYDQMLSPTTRTGTLEIEVDFSDNIKSEIRLLCISEYSCVCSVGPDGKVYQSFNV